jgi:RimJ/RimL family protein N-acetyltransferase
MATGTLFLSDSSQITTVSPIPNITGVSYFSHIHPPTRQQFSKWNVNLSSSWPTPPSLCNDLLTISNAVTSDGHPHPDPVFVLYATLCWYFHLPCPDYLAVPTGTPRNEWFVDIDRAGLFLEDEGIAAAEQAGLIHLVESEIPGDTTLRPRTYKRAIWQVSYPFLNLPTPVVYTTPGVGGAVRHPIRSRPQRRLYRRHIPALNSILTFRLAQLEDAPLVNKWMNVPRVAAFWGEEGTVDQTTDFLRRGLQKRHSFPVIGSWEDVVVRDGAVVESGVQEPFGYFEVYWVKEDVLGAYVDANDWERGIHVLVGEERFRGRERVRGWLGGLIHFCFLDDPRTMTVSTEPRVDNER